MEEVSFPRGGRSRSNKNEASVSKDDATNERKRSRSLPSSKAKATDSAAVERDFLFGVPPSTNASSSSSKKRKTADNNDESSSTSLIANRSSLMPLGGGGVVVHSASVGTGGASKDKRQQQRSKEPLIEALSFSKLAKHTKLLAVVREVLDDVCVVSLPNFLTGYILRDTKKINQKNSNLKEADVVPLTHTLVVGQVLSVTIVKTASEVIGSGRHQTTRRRIQVSAHPNVINPATTSVSDIPVVRGQVTSIEDHGILVHLGHGKQGFLPFDDIEGGYTTDPISEEDDDGDNVNDDNNNKDQPSKYKHRLNVGRILDFHVNDQGSAKKIAPLKLPSLRKLSHLVVPTRSGATSSSPPSLDSLTPGLLVTCKIEALARNGLCVTFWNNAFRGAIELAHLGGTWMPNSRQPVEGSTAWKQVFSSAEKEGRLLKLDARILAVDVATRVIRLTLLPHLLRLQVTPQVATTLFPPVGSVITNATVVRLDPGVGATLALPDEGDSDHVLSFPAPKALKENESYLEARRVRTVYVHISKASDGDNNSKSKNDGKTSESAFAKEFAPTTVHTLRILSTSNWLEGMASASTAPSVVKAHVLTHSDLQPGQVYRQVPICAHLVAAAGDHTTGSGGILVDFGLGIRGIVPAVHLYDTATTSTSDFRTRLFKTKFAMDAKLDVRVLSVDANKKRAVLTAKKSLVQCEDDEIISSFEQVKVGQQVVGFVSKIDDQGLFITFFNGVYGRVTATSLAAELGVENHRQNYHVGDVVKCRVTATKKKHVGSHHRRGAAEEADESDDNDDENMDIEHNGSSNGRRMRWNLLLSLKLQQAESDDEDEREETVTATPTHSSERKSKQLHLRAGAILPPKTLKIVELVKGRPKETGGYVPGYAIVRIKSKYIVNETNAAGLLPFIECKLPYDQLIDHYRAEDTESAEVLDALAEGVLIVGKKINQKGLVLDDPHKSKDEYASGIGRLTVVSLRPKLIKTAETACGSTEEAETSSNPSFILPSPSSQLYVGAYLHGYVVQVHQKHGAFIRFLDGMTGLIPKVKRGLEIPLFDTVSTRLLALDVTSNPIKILLQLASSENKAPAKKEGPTIECGDKIASATVTELNFYRAKLKVTDDRLAGAKVVRARIHCTMTIPKVKLPLARSMKKKPLKNISKYHPFHEWKVGTTLTDLEVVAVDSRKGVIYVELANRLMNDPCDEDEKQRSHRNIFFRSKSELKAGQEVTGIIASVPENNSGIWLQLSPGISGFVPALEITKDLFVLNNMQSHIPVGAHLDVIVTEKVKVNSQPKQLKKKQRTEDDVLIRLSSILRGNSESFKVKDDRVIVPKPVRGDLVVGRIDHSMPCNRPPALMLQLRGHFSGRCCITELDEFDDWINMPLGRGKTTDEKNSAETCKDEDEMETDDNKMDETSQESNDDVAHDSGSRFPPGKYVRCRVLAGVPSHPFVELSLRHSRIEGDVDDDEPPNAGDMVHAYVTHTNKSGCFLQLARKIEGRVILRELCDGFISDPTQTFPMGRLVVGKVKAIRETSDSDNKKIHKKRSSKFVVDLDMRESVLLESQPKLQFEDVELQSKHKGTVTRVESYGVFIRLENSNISGLAHMSECSDKYIKNIQASYDPGDLVKALVIKKDNEGKKLGFSLKASHFENDPDSDDDEVDGDGEDSSDESPEENEGDAAVDDEKDIASDDDNFVSKLASKMKSRLRRNEEVNDEDSQEDDNQDDDDEEDQEVAMDAESSDAEGDEIDDEGPDEGSDSETDEKQNAEVLDTDVGFSWSAGAIQHSQKVLVDDDDSDDSDAEGSDEEDDENAKGASHKSRRKQAQRRREEQETFRREIALADGTADENPETAADFERLLAGSPSSSELWIRYMAFYLSLADTDSARLVAERAFDRIDFRQEGEKLNVWTALLTLEMKYGDEQSLLRTTDRACQHNNPKQIYLRLCEMMAKDARSSPDAANRADEMFTKMCKKFKSKKTVWIANLEYLLKQNRHKEAYSVSKRALVCLPTYKHMETMSKFAQLEFEHGSVERGRTLMDGLLEKYPKRLDILFVYVDKELKFGDVELARRLLEKRSLTCMEQKLKLSDKQMKSLFRKWYRLEEEHGTRETCDKVKDAARAYVERS